MECNGINWEIKCSIGVAVFDSHVRWVYLNLGFVQLFRPWCWSIMGSMFGQMLWGQAKLGVRYLECLVHLFHDGPNSAVFLLVKCISSHAWELLLLSRSAFIRQNRWSIGGYFLLFLIFFWGVSLTFRFTKSSLIYITVHYDSKSSCYLRSLSIYFPSVIPPIGRYSLIQ